MGKTLFGSCSVFIPVVCRFFQAVHFNPDSRERRDAPFRFAAVKLRDRSVRWVQTRHQEALDEVERILEERDGNWERGRAEALFRF